MLKSIYIKDFAIIDELRIDFSNGFNVFTGETGAGETDDSEDEEEESV